MKSLHPIVRRFYEFNASLMRRGDVTILKRSLDRWGALSKKWGGQLPDELHQLLDESNGFSLRYRFKGDDTVHGLDLFGLEKDGKRVILPTGHYTHPRQPVSKYPKGFFKPGQLPDDAVALCLGGSDEVGLVWVGEGNDGALYRRDADGQVERLELTITEALERALDAGLARRWLDEIPETAQVKARLQVPSPRSICRITVEALERRPAFEYHRERVTAWTPEQREKVVKAFGLKVAKDATPDDLITPLALALTRPKALTDKIAKATLAVFGIKHDPTVSHLTQRFGIGAEEVVTATLRFEPVPETVEPYILASLLVGVAELNITAGFADGAFIYGDIYAPKVGVHHPPFLDFDWDQLVEGAKSFRFILTGDQADGLEVGASYESFGLINPTGNITYH